jgi:hypothetical protein
MFLSRIAHAIALDCSMCGRGTEADRSSAVPNALCAKRIKWLFGAIGFQTAIILGPVVALGR